MKMKKAISLILSAAMVLGMASCSPAKQKTEDIITVLLPREDIRNIMLSVL